MRFASVIDLIACFAIASQQVDSKCPDNFVEAEGIDDKCYNRSTERFDEYWKAQKHCAELGYAWFLSSLFLSLSPPPPPP